MERSSLLLVAHLPRIPWKAIRYLFGKSWRATKHFPASGWSTTLSAWSPAFRCQAQYGIGIGSPSRLFTTHRHCFPERVSAQHWTGFRVVAGACARTSTFLPRRDAVFFAAVFPLFTGILFFFIISTVNFFFPLLSQNSLTSLESYGGCTLYNAAEK